MDISIATGWWIATGIAVAAELATGTFYLLMIATGLAAGALAAHLDLSPTAQILLAALIGFGTTGLLHWRRGRLASPVATATNRDVNLDIGERVHVDDWSPDRTARVRYRGSEWTARLAPGAAPSPGRFLVAAVEGNWLVLAPETSRG